jgi:hypothetical protein
MPFALGIALQDLRQGDVMHAVWAEADTHHPASVALYGEEIGQFPSVSPMV